MKLVIRDVISREGERIEVFGGTTYYIRDFLKHEGFIWNKDKKKWIYFTMWKGKRRSSIYDVESLISDIIKLLTERGFKLNLIKSHAYYAYINDEYIQVWVYRVIKHGEEEEVITK